MWYFLLALLFGNPSNNKTNNDQTVTSVQSKGHETGIDGDKGSVRPGK